MTTRQLVVRYLSAGGASARWLTAAQIQNGIQSIEPAPAVVSLGSLSSLLKKMVDDGQLQRRAAVGPRGGFGYRLVRGVKR